MYNINNAFLEGFILLLDNVDVPFRMMPPELLHTSGSGLIMYMFKSLRFHLGGGIDRDYIDQEHVVVNNMIKRQNKCDFSRGSMRMVSLMKKHVNHLNIKETYFDYCA
jgi:hypothetical protein